MMPVEEAERQEEFKFDMEVIRSYRTGETVIVYLSDVAEYQWQPAFIVGPDE